MDKEGRIANIKVCPKAGILLDAIPALGDEFSYSIFESWIWILNVAPRPSTNPSPFQHSIFNCYYMTYLDFEYHWFH